MQRKRKEDFEQAPQEQPSTKKIKSSSSAIPSGTDGGEGNTPSGSGEKDEGTPRRRGKKAEEPVKMPKQQPAKTPK